jgi:ubiquinone/menaquinone biosynthesis C-methylase UbiE
MGKIHIDNLLGRYKSEEFKNLIKNWVGNLDGKKILKTDLREEAWGEDQILFSLSDSNCACFALDIEEETTKNAYMKQKSLGLFHKYVNADVRELPFKNDVFDAIISSSTLDHFKTTDDLINSLWELKRVTKPGGNLIIALNNKQNLNFYLLLKLEKVLGLIPYPVQFYSLKQLRKITDFLGLHIRDTSYIVHIISPFNSLLLLLRYCLKVKLVDALSSAGISLFRWLGNRKRSKFITGWFIVLNCTKKPEYQTYENHRAF